MNRNDEPADTHGVNSTVATGPGDAACGMNAPWPDTLEARVARLLGQGESVVLVTVISRTGSAPRDAGTRALYTQAGPEGTVGGGLLEARAMEAAAQSLFVGRSARVSCDLSGFTPDSDMICGGGMEVLCEVLLPAQADQFALAALALSEGVGGLWVVDVSHEKPARSLFLDSLPQGGALVPGTSLDTARRAIWPHGAKGAPGL